MAAWLTATASFTIGCGGDSTGPGSPAPQRTGWIEVTTETVGVDIDPDGYEISVFGQFGLWSQSVEASGTVLFAELRPALYFVEVTNVAQNCEISGTRLSTLTVTVGDTAQVSFEADCLSTAPLRDQIVFSSDRDGEDWEVYAMRADGGEVQNITRDTSTTDETPAVSPDGSLVAFARDSNIVIINANGRGELELGSGLGDGWNPTWSPDGEEISFSSFAPEHLTFLSLSTGLRTRLRPFPCCGVAFVGSPAWSPDSSTIAFWADPDLNRDIYLLRLEADTTLAVLVIDPAEDEDPAWSPDGSKIAFTSNRDGDFDIYVVNADGTGIVQLTDHPAEDRAPAWSRDGTTIAFETDRDGNFEIYIMNTDGTGPLNLTQHPADDRDPSWSP